MLSMLADSCPVRLPESPVQRNEGPVNGGGIVSREISGTTLDSDLLKVAKTAADI